MLLIYTPELNPRIKYAMEVCFKHVFKITYKITTDITEFEKSNDPVFWYAQEKVSDKPGIIADPMLFDTSIINSPGRSTINDITVLFPTQAYSLPQFDILASVFWYATRMEEYNYYPEDADHRFFSSMSIASKIDSLQKPIVSIWIKLFVEELITIYPDLKYDKPSYKFVPTVDVDSAFMYKHKGFFRNTGGMIRDAFRKDFRSIPKRLKVVFGKEDDPWFCFDKINSLHDKYSLKPKYFFLVGKRGTLDKNISPRKKAMKKLIKNLSDQGYVIGLHPSYRGNKKHKLWKKEFKTLHNITHNEIFSSRQHYVFVTFPETYQTLISLGIKRDYTMLYPDMPGFRLGTTVPLPFFNLIKNEKTELWLYPTMIMDVSLTKYQKLTKEEALEQCYKLINYTKEFGGTFITVWHNESLSEYGNWEGWNYVYEKVLEKAAENEE